MRGRRRYMDQLMTKQPGQSGKLECLCKFKEYAWKYKTTVGKSYGIKSPNPDRSLNVKHDSAATAEEVKVINPPLYSIPFIISTSRKF